MRTVISDFGTLSAHGMSDRGNCSGTTDLGFETLPAELRGRGRGTGAGRPGRPVADRRPCRPRLRSPQVGRGDAGVVVRHPAAGARSLDRVQRAQAGFAALAVVALVSALAVAGLIGSAQLRSGHFDPRTTAPAVQQVPPVR